MPPAKVHGIMMVYRGDDFWYSALDSLVQCRDVFDTLTVSFDGPTRFDLVNLLTETYADSLQPEILVAPEELSSVEHACWIARNPTVTEWAGTDYVVLLSEDDLLRPEIFRAAVAKATKIPGCALFGSWAAPSGEPSETRLLPAIHSVDAIRIGHWLNQVAKSRRPTSITATLTPVEAYRNYISLLQGQSFERTLFDGVRAEYLLVTQAPIKQILSSAEPLAVIQQHQNQESKSLPPRIWAHDEALFQLWLVMTPIHIGILARGMAVLRFLKWISRDLSTLIDLPNAIETFGLARRSVRHSTD